jgi:hypothetical protein
MQARFSYPFSYMNKKRHAAELISNLEMYVHMHPKKKIKHTCMHEFCMLACEFLNIVKNKIKPKHSMYMLINETCSTATLKWIAFVIFTKQGNAM